MTVPPANPEDAGPGVSTIFSAARAEQLYLWSRRWMEARRDVATTSEQRTKAVRDHLDRMKGLEDGSWIKEFHKRMEFNDPDFHVGDHPAWVESEFAETVRYFRLEAECWLAASMKSAAD